MWENSPVIKTTPLFKPSIKPDIDTNGLLNLSFKLLYYMYNFLYTLPKIIINFPEKYLARVLS